MASLIEKQDDDTWTVTCKDERCGYTSSKHLTKSAAKLRGDEHTAEHEEGDA